MPPKKTNTDSCYLYANATTATSTWAGLTNTTTTDSITNITNDNLTIFTSDDTTSNNFSSTASTNYTFELKESDFIEEIKILVPNKVMEVTLNGNLCWGVRSGTYKMVVREPDVFDMEFGCALAIAKAIYSTVYTPDYVEEKAYEILKTKYYLKEIRKAIKKYNKKVAEEKKAQKAEEERKAIIARRRAKNKKRKEKMRARKKQEEINTIAEAIKLAKE